VLRPALEEIIDLGHPLVRFAREINCSTGVLPACAHRVTGGRKMYALHAAEVECIGKGKARAPYEFGCKVSVAEGGHPISRHQSARLAQAIRSRPAGGKSPWTASRQSGRSGVR